MQKIPEVNLAVLKKDGLLRLSPPTFTHIPNKIRFSDFPDINTCIPRTYGI